MIVCNLKIHKCFNSWSTLVFGFNSKVEMCKHLNSPQNIYASTNPGNLLWKCFIFRDTLFIRVIYKHHHYFTWKPWTCPCRIYPYNHAAATPGAAYPPRLGLAYLGQYLAHILSKVYIRLRGHSKWWYISRIFLWNLRHRRNTKFLLFSMIFSLK